MLLDVVLDLLGVRSLERLNRFVILFKFLKLLFEFLAAGVEASFQVRHQLLHLLKLACVLLAHFLLARVDHALVA